MGKKVIKTFKEFDNYNINMLKQDEPSCFNGFVRFKKVKITIEEIEEPKEVLSERLQKLWDENDNHHHWQPLKSAANSIGYKLQGSAGSKRKPKTK